MRILIIDDEKDFAEFVGDAVESFEHEPAICTDANEIGKFYSTSHEIIILDLFMPGLDGIEVLRFLHDNNAKTTVIFMSGKDKSVLHSARELATEWGFPVLGALEKPFSIDDLEVTIGKFEPIAKKGASLAGQNFGADDIKAALRDDRFSLVYQPQIRLADRMVCGVEALIRWVDPEKGFISPGEFIPFAERNGLIEGINNFVARHAIEQLGLWRQKGHDLTISINVSPASIANVDLPKELMRIAQQNNIPSSAIIIELTETAVMSDAGRYMDILTRLRMKGFELAIDDFGTGYSSLQQLVRLPFTKLKIDQAFITHICDDKECETVAAMATELAHRLGMKVVAEGVEDKAAMDLIQSHGCDEIQGYYCARPMPPDQLDIWLQESEYAPLPGRPIHVSRSEVL